MIDSVNWIDALVTILAVLVYIVAFIALDTVQRIGKVENRKLGNNIITIIVFILLITLGLLWDVHMMGFIVSAFVVTALSFRLTYNKTGILSKNGKLS